MKKFIRQVKIVLIACLSIVAFILIMSRWATPLSPLTFQAKRLQEKVFMRLKSNPQSKLEYYTYLLNERCKELRSVVESESPSYILTTSLRYSTTAGQLTELIIGNHLDSSIEITQKLFRNHQQIISGLIMLYPKDFDDEWKYLQDDINYLDIYSKMLSEYAQKGK